MAKRAQDNKAAFEVGQHVVYPAHGVGSITGIEKESVAGIELEVYVVSFEQEPSVGVV